LGGALLAGDIHVGFCYPDFSRLLLDLERLRQHQGFSLTSSMGAPWRFQGPLIAMPAGFIFDMMALVQSIRTGVDTRKSVQLEGGFLVMLS